MSEPVQEEAPKIVKKKVPRKKRPSAKAKAKAKRQRLQFIIFGSVIGVFVIIVGFLVLCEFLHEKRDVIFPTSTIASETIVPRTHQRLVCKVHSTKMAEGYYPTEIDCEERKFEVDPETGREYPVVEEDKE